VTEPEGLDMNVERPTAKVKEETNRSRQGAATSDSFSSPAQSESERLLSQIERLIDEACSKSQRTALPKAWDRFPVNRSRLLSRWILRSYEFMFRDQRGVNFTLINAVQNLANLCVLSLGTKADLSRVAVLEERLVGKADRTDVEALASVVQQKADLTAVQTLEDTLVGKADRTDVEALASVVQQKADLAAVQTLEDTLIARTDPMETQQIRHQINDHKYNILDLQRRLTVFLEETRKHLPESSSTGQLEALTKEGDGILDALYVSFEDRFRGTRADIKDRQKVYLQYIKEAASVTPKTPVIDLGCGRGEWLEILRDNGYSAKGIDANPIMVELCQELKFDVIKEEATQFLRQRKSGSVGVVTAFHLIEHLPLKKIVSLLDESLRVLRPGGVIILESPNPENIMVGACYFYLDPTHRNPLPPDTTAFLLEARGFVRVEIIRLNSITESSQITENDISTSARFNELFCGPLDYAVIGWKT